MRLGLSITIVGVLAAVAGADALQWQKDWSKKQLGIAEAEAFCKKNGKGWRLPNELELKSMLIDPEATESKFRDDAPALPQTGYLWSGEDVSPSRRGQKWIMNLANGHVFNGTGRTGYAKCVKGTPRVEPAPTLDAPYATIGPADAKLVIVVAMQPDYFWSKVRPTLDKLIESHSVRFALHLYLTDRDKYLGPSLELCAPDGSADAKRACLATIDNDAKFFRKQMIGVPTFWIGKQRIDGAQPIEKFEAAIKAAGS